VDSETGLIQAGNLTPPLVCVSIATRDPAGTGFVTSLHDAVDGISMYEKMIIDPALLLVIHNGPFDLGVACNERPSLIFDVFDAIDAGRAVCTIVIQKLIDIALGMRKFRRLPNKTLKTTYGLADLIALYYNEEVVAKDDTWRKSYMLLKPFPLSRWPVNAKKYAIGDAIHHLRVFEAEQSLISRMFGGYLPNQVEQQRANWVLHLMSMWGIRADAEKVDYFIKHCQEEIAKMREKLYDTCIRCGELRKDHNDIACASKPREKGDVDPVGFKNTGIFRVEGHKFIRTMEAIRLRVIESCNRRGVAVPMTDPSTKFPAGQVQTDKDTLQLCDDDPHLAVLAEQMTFAKHLGQWGPVLRAAVLRPVCCRYEVLVETGRTASSGSEGQEGTNIQNPPRKGDVRPAIIPRDGNVLCSTDADTIELRAQAQNCIEIVGWSKMADAIIDQFQNGGPDLHERLGGNLVSVPATELRERRKAGDAEMIDARQFSKIPGFGLWGGLGAETLVSYAAAQLSREQHRKWFGVTREEQLKKGQWIRDVWFETWPEARYYFEKVGHMIDRKKGYGIVQQLMSMRIRGEVRFTAAANGFFQGRVADAEKEILWRLGVECYTGRETNPDGSTSRRAAVLWGSRPVMFLHDEPILEHPEASADERAERQRIIVVETLSKWMPAIPCTSSAVLTRRWHKGAEPGFLCPQCETYSDKKRCKCGMFGKLVPVRPLKIADGVGADGKEKYKIKWEYDSGTERPLIMAA
jgi:DNA polymerase-1